MTEKWARLGDLHMHAGISTVRIFDTEASDSRWIVDPGGTFFLNRALHVDFAGRFSAVHDKSESSRCVTSHEVTDHAIGFQMVVHFDL